MLLKHGYCCALQMRRYGQYADKDICSAYCSSVHVRIYPEIVEGSRTSTGDPTETLDRKGERMDEKRSAEKIREDLATAEDELQRLQDRITALRLELAIATLVGWVAIDGNVLPLGSEGTLEHGSNGGSTLTAKNGGLDLSWNGYDTHLGGDWGSKDFQHGDSACVGPGDRWVGFFATREEAEAFATAHEND